MVFNLPRGQARQIARSPSESSYITHDTATCVLRPANLKLAQKHATDVLAHQRYSSIYLYSIAFHLYIYSRTLEILIFAFVKDFFFVQAKVHVNGR